MNTGSDPAAQSWYVTCSLSMHEHPDYDRVIQQIWSILQYIRPDDENKLVEARGLYSGGKDWQEKWPKVRDSLTGGLFFTVDVDGYIGRGVYTEVLDTIKKGLPCYLVMPDGNFFPITDFSGPAFIDGPDWRTYLFIDVKLLSQGTDPTGFEKSDFGDFEEQIKPVHWKQVHTRLTTPTMEATLQAGILILKFTGGITKALERPDVEALTRFLNQHAGVEDLPDLDDEPTKEQPK